MGRVVFFLFKPKKKKYPWGGGGWFFGWECFLFKKPTLAGLRSEVKLGGLGGGGVILLGRNKPRDTFINIIIFSILQSTSQNFTKNFGWCGGGV